MKKANIAFKEKIEQLNIELENINVESVNDGIRIKELEYNNEFWKRSFAVLSMVAISLLIHVVFSLTATS